MAYKKYKDAIPSETIKNITNIHKDLGIEYSLTANSNVPGIYAAVFKDDRANWCTCGKGTDEEFCCASALGESIEHLCNLFAYDMTSLSLDAEQYLVFKLYPDDKLYSVEKIKELCPFVMEDLRDAYMLSYESIPEDGLWK